MPLGPRAGGRAGGALPGHWRSELASPERSAASALLIQLEALSSGFPGQVRFISRPRSRNMSRGQAESSRPPRADSLRTKFKLPE
jgi:hypothetical protein